MSSEAPPDYTAAAQIVTLFGCVPLGMVAQVCAQQANVRFALGDPAGAHVSAAKARQWCWAAGVAGVLIWLAAFYGLGHFAAAQPPAVP